LWTQENCNVLPSERLALYGCDEPLPSRLLLRAGPVSVELVGGRFGPVRGNGHEVWHGLAFLFRGACWGTPEPVFEDVRHLVNDEGRGFQLELRGHIPCMPADVANDRANGARILLELQVQGDADGQLHFLARSSPTHDLLTNRCGWVLMHPMSAAGSAVEVRHVDGRISRSSFPIEVPAWPPFTSVGAITHEYAPGHWAEALLPGEDYELEDQRNNADASFKTYSRSNFMPRPYVLRRLQSQTRELHLRLLGLAPALRRNIHCNVDTTQPIERPSALSLETAALNAPALRFPRLEDYSPAMRLGMAFTPEMSRPPAAWVLAVLAEWRPSFLHLTLWPETSKEAVDWSGVCSLLQAAGASLRLDLCGLEGLGQGGVQDNNCRALAEQMMRAGVVPTALAALPCGPQAASFLRQVFPASAIGGGTPHFFAQLNRLEVIGGEDFMGFTVCPIVHGSDDEAVMHGLQSLPSMLATARLRHPGRHWHLGPNTLSARASPLGPQPPTDGQRRVALANRDPRTRGLFGAAWLLGHLAVAARAEVQALTMPPILGDDGLWWFTGTAWQMTPSAALLKVCLSWYSLDKISIQVGADKTSAPFNWPLAGIVGRTAHGRQVLLANLSAYPETLHWPHGGQWASIDATAWLQHRAEPAGSPWRESGACPYDLVLAPYGLVRIDLPLQTRD
jgi:D-apionolactonase